MTTNRSDEELAMRGLIVPELRKRYPASRIIHELPLRYSSNRIDLAAVTEREIVAVEIKSSRDVIDRLEAQLRAFAPISSRIIVALAPKWNERLPVKITHRPGSISHEPQFTETQQLIRSIGCSWLETWTVDAAAGSIEPTQESWRANLPWTAEMLHMLHVEELIDIAHRRRISVAKRATHREIYEECFGLLTGQEIVSDVCRALRARDAFADGTDAPIVAAKRPSAPVENRRLI